MSASVLFETVHGTVFAPAADSVPVLQIKYKYDSYEECETEEYMIDEWGLLAPLAKIGFSGKEIDVKFKDCTMRARLVADVSSDYPGYGYWLDYV
jgi:hypothetical protein